MSCQPIDIECTEGQLLIFWQKVLFFHCLITTPLPTMIPHSPQVWAGLKCWNAVCPQLLLFLSHLLHSIGYRGRSVGEGERHALCTGVKLTTLYELYPYCLSVGMCRYVPSPVSMEKAFKVWLASHRYTTYGERRRRDVEIEIHTTAAAALSEARIHS